MNGESLANTDCNTIQILWQFYGKKKLCVQGKSPVVTVHFLTENPCLNKTLNIRKSLSEKFTKNGMKLT